VSVDPPGASDALQKRLGVPITFLSDPDGKLMDALHVRDRNSAPSSAVADGRSADLFMPTSFLVDENQVIRWVYRPDTFRVRAPAQQVLAEIDRMG